MATSTKHKSGAYTITGRYGYTTDRAVQFRVDNISGVDLPAPKLEWFPFSQVEKSFRNPNANGGDWLIVSGWILEQKDLMKYVNAGVSKPREEQDELHKDTSYFDDDIHF